MCSKSLLGLQGPLSLLLMDTSTPIQIWILFLDNIKTPRLLFVSPAAYMCTLVAHLPAEIPDFLKASWGLSARRICTWMLAFKSKVPAIPNKKVPQRKDSTDGTRQCSWSNLLSFVENDSSNLAEFGLVSTVFFKTSSLGEMLLLLSGPAVFFGDSTVCKSRAQVKL